MGVRMYVKNILLWKILTFAGFFVALAESFVFPAKQNVNETPYRLLLVGFIVFYAVLLVVSTARKTQYINRGPFRFACGVVLAVYDFLSTKSNIMPLPFFPGPAQIFQVLVEDRMNLLKHTAFSLRLFFVGFLVGIIIGIVTGVIIGWYAVCNYWIFPVLKVTGVIPAVAWIPIAMAIFPSSFIAGVFLIAICSWFPVAFMVSTGISATPKTYFEAARTLGGNSAFLLFRIALPNAVPALFTGVSTATGLSFGTLVVSEMVGAKAGLGFYINWAKGWSAYSKVFAAIIVMAVAFSIVLWAINLVRCRLLIWQAGIVTGRE
ncbi:hypothetical protein AGMMS49975_17070 [Clostridia bacterium]|nr:hypothetical protein AGMMS49975_17070 [Clostridia bacterium]